jgi:GPI transamidase subunit PIG-U
MNPITNIASAISVNLQNVVTYLILHTLCNVTSHGIEIPSKVYLAFTLSILTYIDIHYTILLIPILIVLIQPIIPQEQALHPPRNNDTRTGVIISTVVFYILFSTALLAPSVLLVSRDAYGTIIILTHLHTFRSFQFMTRPNLYLLWY